MVKRNLYVAANPLYDRVTTPRHSVISIAKYDGAPAAFDASVMQASDRAEIHSILHGRSLTLAQLTENELSNCFLQTQYAAYDCAHLLRTGQPVVDAISAAKGETKQPVVSAVKLSGTLYVSFGIERILEDHRTAGHSNPGDPRFARAIRFTINQLSDAYSNKFCRAFLRHHNGLSKIA